MVVELGVAVVVVEGGGVFIMGHMWVHGGEGVVMVVAMGFWGCREVSGVYLEES